MVLTSGRCWNGQHTVQIWILRKIYRQFKQRLRKQTVFWENFEEKVYEIWNEIDPDVVRNLYENYANRLLDVKKAKGVMTRY